MNSKTVKAELEDAIASGNPFGPASPDEPMLELPGQTLRDLIRARSGNNEGEECLWLRRVCITTALDLEAVHIDLRLLLEDCEFKETVNLRQARVSDLRLLGSRFCRELWADESDLRWNLRLDGSTLERGLGLRRAKVGGQVSLNRATLLGEEKNGTTNPALNGDGLEVVGDFFCRREFEAKGEVRLLGAKIGGQVSFNSAKMSGGKNKDGDTSPALHADGLEVTGDLFCREKVVTTGEVRLLGAKIGGQVSFNSAKMSGGKNKDGDTSPALHADGIKVGGGLFLRHDFKATGEVRLLRAEINRTLSMGGATFEARMNQNKECDALSMDRAEVMGNMFCEGFSATGSVRMLGVRVNGWLSMSKATLKGAERDGTVGAALNADGISVAQGLYFRESVATGEVRMLNARIANEFSIYGATLEGKVNHEGDCDAISLDRARVEGNLTCDRLTAKGRVRMLRTRIDGQLSMVDVTLEGRSEQWSGSSFSLIAGQVDELILMPKKVVGTVDLRNTSVRSLWDAEREDFVGQLPEQMSLEGFTYRSLRAPLDAEKRLVWIAPSQRKRHYPGVYAELANAFRRMGRQGDARRIAIANERRAREDYGRLSPRGIGHDLLYVTIGYGYRNWLAIFWLSTLILIGAAVFALGESSFVATTRYPPPFDPVLYAIDVTIPVLDLNQTRSWAADGCMSWTGLVLAISGYALAAAVIAAAAGLFNRDNG
jgi:hypothetical protein